MIDEKHVIEAEDIIIGVIERAEEEAINICTYELGRTGMDYVLARKLCDISINFIKLMMIESLLKQIEERDMFEELSNYWGE